MNEVVDVLVVGGGAAGVAATVGAARAGASVLMLERNGYCGGMATGALVGTVCGLYYRNPQSAVPVHKGFCADFSEKLSFYSKTHPQKFLEDLWYLPYEPFAFRKVCDEFLLEASAKVLFHSTVYGIQLKEDHIHEVSAHVWDRSYTFYPQAVIDCTGEGAICRMAQEEELEHSHYQAGAVVFQLKGIAAQSETLLRKILFKEVIEGVQKGILQKECESISIVPGSHREDEVYVKIALPLLMDRALQSVSLAEQQGRLLAAQLLSYFASGDSVFKDARVGVLPSHVGVRTGPRFKGRVILRDDDVLSAKKTNDAIGRGAWPIELWTQDRKPQMSYFKSNDHYDIPQGALKAAKTKNLFFAGRNLSAQEQAAASARVIGTCLQTGYASGIMAAYAAHNASMEAAVTIIKQQSGL